MADVFFPQYLPRRPAPQGAVGAYSQANQIAAATAGAQAEGALRAASQANKAAAQGFQVMGEHLEILNRERKVLEETRSQHWLMQAKQAAQNEIDLYMTSPGSESFTSPEKIPDKVGEILSKHYKALGQQLGNYDPLTRENAAYEYESYAAQTMPGVRHEKTARIRDEAIAGAQEFVDTKKKEFFKEPTDAGRNKIFDSMLGRMEFLREQGYISREQEEKFQIGLGQELVNESITQRISTLTLQTPSGLVAQLYKDIETTSLIPSEKAAQTHALDSHMSYLLNQDTREKSLAEQERRENEEAALKSVYDLAIDGGNLKGALATLKALRETRVVDTGSYLQHASQLMKMSEVGDPTRKHSDPSAIITGMVEARLAGSKDSSLKTYKDVQDAAVKLAPLYTPGDLKNFVDTATDKIQQYGKQQVSEQESELHAVVRESNSRIDDFYQEAQAAFGINLKIGLNPQDSQLASQAKRQIQRYVEQNPQAQPDDVRIYTDSLILTNQQSLDKIFAQKSPELYNKTMGIGINTIDGLQDEYKAGRITLEQRNMLGQMIQFRDKYIQGLAAQKPGTQAGVPPKPKAAGTNEPGAISQGMQWLGDTWNQMTGPQKKQVEQKAYGKSFGGYLNRIKDYLWQDEQSGNKPTASSSQTGPK